MRGKKRCVYIGDSIRKEVENESQRVDRSINWLFRKAWVLAKEDIKKIETNHEINR